MTGLDELLGEEYATPEAQFYLQLAREDQNMLAKLVELRRERMSQEEVAQALGISQASVSAFERVGNDPKLSTIRRYAKVVGAMVRHHVDGDAENCGNSHYLSHVSDDGVSSAETAAARARKLTRLGAAWPEQAFTREVRPTRPKALVDDSVLA